jgi:ribosomal protein S18 acetylase RimI-like enzyme
MLERPFRFATPDDARALAELVNIAGEGLPYYVWSGMTAPGQDPWDVGRQRAARDSGSFSYRNAVVREAAGGVAAALIGYPLDDDPPPADYGTMPPMFVPLQQLEDQVPGTWYINVLATYPPFRGRGYGTELLAIAEQLARSTSRTGLSLIVSDGNPGAIRLYRRSAFVEAGRRPMIKDAWDGPGREWILMTRMLPAEASG